MLNSLGYVNVFWIRQFMDWAIQKSDGWFVETYPDKSDFEEDGYLIVPYSGNRRSLLLFVEHGLDPVFSSLNAFQKVLVLDCLAILIAKDDPELWKLVNFYDVILGDRIRIADDPVELFGMFFDFLSVGYVYSLAEHREMENYRYDPTDALELYKYC